MVSRYALGAIIAGMLLTGAVILLIIARLFQLIPPIF